MIPINLEYDPKFLEEEERDGYLVTEEMKKLWLVELDIMNKFIQVCDKYGLVYYAEGGTLLGAVRHKGYVPWDDDIDLIMFREDYDIFISIFEKEFKYPYYLEYETTPSLHIKIKRLDTVKERLRYENGIPSEDNKHITRYFPCIGIDVFCFDNCPEDASEISRFQEDLKYKAYLYRQSIILYEFFYHDVKQEKKLDYLKESIGVNFDLLNKEFQRYNKKDTKYVFNNAFTKELVGLKQVKYKEDYDKPIYLQFEMFDLRCPGNYKRVLDMHYSNRTGIPWETPTKNLAYHDQNARILLDVDNPWTKYYTWFYDRPEDLNKIPKPKV